MKKGFTLIELLVAIGIILLVAVLAAVTVHSARATSRDAVRLSNIRQAQSALEDYFNENNSYPAGANLPLGDVTLSSCLSATGFHGDCSGESRVLLRTVLPAPRGGLEGLSQCGTPPRDAFCYSQRGEGEGYAIQFELENALPQAELVAGPNCAMPSGMKAGRCQ